MYRLLSLLSPPCRIAPRVALMLGAVVSLLSGCSNLHYKHAGGRPLRVAIDKVKINEHMRITGLTEAIGGVLAMAPGTGAAVQATGSALQNKGVQLEPVPQNVVKAALLETFSAGLRRDPRFQLVAPPEAEALFRFDLTVFFASGSTFDRRIAAHALMVSELQGQDGSRRWQYVTLGDDPERRERHDPDAVRRDPEVRARALQQTVREVAEEHLAHLRK